MAHHRDQHFRGQFQERGVEPAFDGGGILRQVRQRFEQGGVHLGARNRPRHGRVDRRKRLSHRWGRRFRLPTKPLQNPRPPLVRRQNHAVLAQSPFVVFAGDGHLRRAQPPVSRRQIPRAHAADLERHHLVAQQRHQPADGADEPRAALARPVHRLGEVDSQNDAGQRRRQNIFGCASRHLFVEDVVLALGRGLDGEVRGRRALLAREPFDGLRGRALRRPLHPLHAIRLALRQPRGAQHQPPRRGVHLHGFVRNSQAHELRAQILQRVL